MSRKVLFINKKYNRNCQKVRLLFKKIAFFTVNYSKIISSWNFNFLNTFEIVSDYLSVFFQFTWICTFRLIHRILRKKRRCLSGHFFTFFDSGKNYFKLYRQFKFQKFNIKDFFSKCDQIRSFLRIWSYLLKKSLISENLIFRPKGISKYWRVTKVPTSLQNLLIL